MGVKVFAADSVHVFWYMVMYFLSVYGIATIISGEYIFSPVVDLFKKYEKFYYLLTCNKCLTVWIAFIMSLFCIRIYHPVIDAAAAYTVTCFINAFLDRMTNISENLD